MNTIYIYTFFSIFITSLISLIGVLTLAISKDKLMKLTIFLVSLSAGTLLGGAALHLMPEVINNSKTDNEVWLYFLGGIIIFFILEKIICWRHCHIPTSHNHPHPLGIMNLVGDGLHNFIDGMVVAGTYAISIPLGLTTTIAIIAHEIPQEIADFGVLVHSGMSIKKALKFNFLTSLSSFAGAGIIFLISLQAETMSSIIIPIAAGGFLYIATADLIPELKKDTKISSSIGQLASIVAGILIMLYLKILFE